MTQEPSDAPGDQRNPARPWQIAVAVLGVLLVTLLIINVILRVRADDAAASEAAALAQVEGLKAENAQLAARSEQLLTQLSTSHERLAGITDQLGLTEEQIAAADANVAKQVAAQRAAERALRRADSGLRRARAQVVALEAQLANARTCSAGALKALAQIHAGPDIESGATDAAATLSAVMPACQAGLK